MLYMAITFLSPGALPSAVASLHVEIILGFLAILATVTTVGGARLGQRPATYLVLGLLASTCVSMMATGWFGGALQTFLGFVPSLILYYFVAANCRSMWKQQVMVYTILLVAFYIIAQGGMAIRADQVSSPWVVDENGVLRLCGMGTIHDPNDTGQLFVMLIPLLWLRWKKGTAVGNVLFTMLPTAVLLFGLYLTHSRGDMIALVALLMFALKDKLGVTGSAVLGALTLVGIVALNATGGRGITDDDGGRVAAWVTGLETFKSHFILGVGPNNFNEYNPTGMTAHNSVILAMVELGAVGFFFWMGSIVASWTELNWLAQKHQKSRLGPSSDLRRLEMATTLRDKTSPEVAALIEAPAGAPAMISAAMVRRAARMQPRPIEPTNAWTPYRDITPLADMDEEVTSEALAWSAKVTRVSMVGLLVAGLFLSRTYSSSLYTLLGFSAALVGLSHEDPPKDTRKLVVTTCVACVSSFILLYLFVRLHGVR